MTLSSVLGRVQERVLQGFATDAERRAAFANMGPNGGSGIGAPIGGSLGKPATGTRAGRYVDSGGVNAKGQAAKTTGIHVPSFRHPGRGGRSKIKGSSFKDQVAARLGLTPKQLAQATHAVSRKSPQRLIAGVKTHTRLASNAAAQRKHGLAAQHRQLAQLHRNALKAYHASVKSKQLANRAATKARSQEKSSEARVNRAIRFKLPVHKTGSKLASRISNVRLQLGHRPVGSFAPAHPHGHHHKKQ